ncbi:hypothetical protein KIW84_051319 [Lathyrus oleraceus]|uniref:DUF7745 domain-containing protein n=1 Tax=Pisum sativum TaxID=3888 RepID=A0A9D4WLS7_PEA|nr:hypothetical protein KIW84_051319 [Pisum sativum]
MSHKTTDCGRRNTKKYSFRCPNLKELRKLASFVLDPLDFKQRHGKLLSILSADMVEGLLSVLFQFYDPLYCCFTFPDYQLVPTFEDYEFLIKEATAFALAGSVDAFEAIFVLLIYGLALFPNIDGFVDVNAIRIFLIGNPVPTLLGDMYFSFHLRNSKGGGTIVYFIPLLYKWFILHLPQTPAFVENNLEIVDCCGEFSNVPLIGTQGGINYNPALAHPQLGKERSELGPYNCVALEAYTLWVKKRAMELKMSYVCERPMSMVVVEPLTLPNQDVEELEDALAKMKQEKDIWEERFHALGRKYEELHLESKDKDALIELLEDQVTKRQRESEVSSSSSMPQPSVAWKKIIDQLVLEKTQMKASFEAEIRRIRRKYAPTARSSNIVVRDP